MSFRDIVDRVRRLLPSLDRGINVRHPVALRPADKGRTTDYDRVDPEEIQKAEEAHRRRPDDDGLRYSLAFLLYASRQYNAARKHFEVLLAKGYEPAQIHFHIGSCLYQLNHKPEARREWEACLEEEPDPSIERLVRRRLQWFQVPEQSTVA